MEYMLVSNCCMPLLHMSKSYIWIEETNQRINQFSFGYMMNPDLYRNKALKQQVKVCFRNTFGLDTTSRINTILMKKNTIVLALVIFYESGNINPRKMFKVLSCVIYTIIEKYVCIDYLGTEKKEIRDLNIGSTLSSKHDGMDYNNLFGIGIPDVLLDIFSCHGFLKNDDSIVILKCPNRMSEYYFNKGFVELTCDEYHF